MPCQLSRNACLPCLLALSFATSCSTKTATTPVDGTATTPSVETASAKATATAAPSAPLTSVIATAVASSAPQAPSAAIEVDAGPSPAEAVPSPLPAVKVANIGMHIGGGPNDSITKEPIRRSVEPHFDEFRRCFALVVDAKKAGNFGVDLRIDRSGGKAKVSHPRTTLKGKPFVECVVRTYENIDFLKPKGGTTTVSYSLRFTP